MNTEIPINLIDANPYQLRSSYDSHKMDALVESIQKYGLKQTPVGRKVGERYQLAFGHQRLEAFKKLQEDHGYTMMPLKIEELSDEQMFELYVIENMQREDLSPIDKAVVLQKYMEEFGANSRKAAKLFGIEASTVRGLIRLLKLPEDAKEQIKRGEMTQSVGRELLAQPLKSGYHQRKVRENEEYESSKLRIKLILLVYGKYQQVTDDELYKEIKGVFDAVKMHADQL